MLRCFLALALGALAAACGARTGLVVPDGSPDVPPTDSGCPFALDARVGGTLHVTADDHYRLWVNGTLLDETVRLWSEPQTYSVSLFRHPGRRNTIALEARNVWNADGRDRGVLADLRAIPGGAEVRLVTDATWRLSTTLVSGWSDVAFDASGWKSALSEGKHPMPPWGPVFGVSDAQWLWSYDSNLPSDAKVMAETIYVRRDFHFATEGTIVSAPGTCP